MAWQHGSRKKNRCTSRWANTWPARAIELPPRTILRRDSALLPQVQPRVSAAFDLFKGCPFSRSFKAIRMRHGTSFRAAQDRSITIWASELKAFPDEGINVPETRGTQMLRFL